MPHKWRHTYKMNLLKICYGLLILGSVADPSPVVSNKALTRKLWRRGEYPSHHPLRLPFFSKEMTGNKSGSVVFTAIQDSPLFTYPAARYGFDKTEYPVVRDFRKFSLNAAKNKNNNLFCHTFYLNFNTNINDYFFTCANMFILTKSWSQTGKPLNVWVMLIGVIRLF